MIRTLICHILIFLAAIVALQVTMSLSNKWYTINHVVTNKGGGGTQKDHVMGTWGMGVWFWSKFVQICPIALLQYFKGFPTLMLLQKYSILSQHIFYTSLPSKKSETDQKRSLNPLYMFICPYKALAQILAIAWSLGVYPLKYQIDIMEYNNIK